jgi:AraC-like DNA-binding protein
MSEGNPAGRVPVQRVELATGHMDVMAEISQTFVEHRPRFRCVEQGRIDAGVRIAIAGGLGAGQVRYRGFEYQALADPLGRLLAGITVAGNGALRSSGAEVLTAPGDAFLHPPQAPFSMESRDSEYSLLAVPLAAAGALAEEMTGLPAAGLRFEALTPVSASLGERFGTTVDFICDQVAASAITEIHPLVAQELTRLAAGAMLEVFPNTTMTAGYLPGPGWIAAAAVNRAAAFIDARAGEPVTVQEIAAAADVSVFALQYAFQRHFGTTAEGYLRRIRLERAHHDLAQADPVSGITVEGVARRWGWATLGQFTVAYQRRFGVPPRRILGQPPP